MLLLYLPGRHCKGVLSLVVRIFCKRNIALILFRHTETSCFLSYSWQLVVFALKLVTSHFDMFEQEIAKLCEANETAPDMPGESASIESDMHAMDYTVLL